MKDTRESALRRRELSCMWATSVPALALACVLLVGPVAAQELAGRSRSGPWVQTRTPWGDPDLQGIYAGDNSIGIPVERPARFGTRRFLTEEEFAERAKEAEARAARPIGNSPPRQDLRTDLGDFGNGTPEHWFELGQPSRMTSLVIEPPDGRIPLTAPAKQAADWWQTARFGIGAASWLDLDVWDRCITRGLPTIMVPNAYNNGYQIFQTPEYVAIAYEMIHDVRIIPLTDRPLVGKAIQQWMGASRGRWEGNTLVVEVTNFSDKTFGTLQPAGSYLGGGKDLRIIERYTLVDSNTLHYQATVEDPQAFTKPWTILIPLERNQGYKIYEYACHEGNYSLPNILSGARAQERGAEKEGKK
jgi:hypothetical protein